MDKTSHAKNLDLIQTEVHKDLIMHGFRKRRRTFYRALDSGLIHVINFQMGRRSLSGNFTINLGIYIPEVYRLIWDKDTPKHVDLGCCEINKRMGELLSPPIDLWWDLNKKPKKLSRTVILHINKHGLPYLDRFNTRNDIIREWREYGIDIGLPPRGDLSIAILLVFMGEHEQARSLLNKEYQRKKNESYGKFVIDIAQKLGMSLTAE